MSHILIVDDSQTIRRMVKASLAPLGAEFIEAASGLEAIERLAVGSIQLMVLDLNMPDMHGIDVLKFVRKNPNYRTLPVVVLTTRGDDTSRQTAQQAGATSYMTKPFAPQMLAKTVEDLLQTVVDASTRG